MRLKYCIIAFLNLIALSSVAQKDSAQRINITSSYKPTIQEPSKIPLSPSQIQRQEQQPDLRYNIPSQQLNFAYEPISLKPLALSTDSSMTLGNRNYLKAGFGNFTSPYFRAGLSMGDGTTMLASVTAGYNSSKGKIEHQDYSSAFLKAGINYFLQSNEFYLQAGLDQNIHHLYGYDHSKFTFNKSDIRQTFRNFSLLAGLRNTKKNDLGILYDPNLKLNFFSFVDGARETGLRLSLPVEKTFNDKVIFKLTPVVDISSYTTLGYIPNNIKFTNNVVLVTPAIKFGGNNFTLDAGITPAWDNSEFNLMPNIKAEIKMQGQPFSVIAGWEGEIVKNTMQNLATENPYIRAVLEQKNTKQVEIYGGLKVALGEHFNFLGKVGMIQYTNLALFVNDAMANAVNNQFHVVYEPDASNFRIQSSVQYLKQDKFSMRGTLNLNGYTGIDVNHKAWHRSPLDLNLSAKLLAIKNLAITSDLFIFKGGKYLLPNNNSGTLNGGTDLNFGAEYTVNKRIGVWAQANNILNNKYVRWFNYPVYGANFLGGVVVKF